jgi:hypothetical protein
MTEENGQRDVVNEELTERTEPTNEQLANFACVLISGPGFGTMQQQGVVAMFEAFPELRERWLEYHAEFQQKANELEKTLIEEHGGDIARAEAHRRWEEEDSEIPIEEKHERD